jgi:hypothetical protein
LFFCLQKITTVRPPCNTVTVAIPWDNSYLSTPLVIPTRIIEEKLINSIGKYIINDIDFDNLDIEGKKDKLKLKVTRLGDIQVSWKGNVATCSAPLRVLLERQVVGNKVLPLAAPVSLKSEFMRVEMEVL